MRHIHREIKAVNRVEDASYLHIEWLALVHGSTLSLPVRLLHSGEADLVFVVVDVFVGGGGFTCQSASFPRLPKFSENDNHIKAFANDLFVVNIEHFGALSLSS